MNALACFQFPATKRLLNLLNDPELMNCLSDALLRCKTRRVNALLSIVIRMLLWQKYLCGKSSLSNSIEFDYFDCSEVRKFYALEFIKLAHRIPDHVIANAHTIFEDTDDLIKFRWQNSIRKTQSIANSNFIDHKNKDQTDYFYGILKINCKFGCTSSESCLNPNAPFKRIIDQIIDDSNRFKDACAKNPNIKTQFSSEIHYVCELFNCLQNDL